MRIAIVDYGMGNLVSVRNALTEVGAEVAIASNGSGLDDANAIVLPGVGAFGAGISGLRERGLVEPLTRAVRERGKPMLGICLGMQLLAKTGHELGEHTGLGWIQGGVARLNPPGLRVPHIGWNEVRGSGSLFRNIPSGTTFYFVHSYHLTDAAPEVVAGRTEYGVEIVSAVEAGNVVAVQFHPEKSHKSGLKLLANFLEFARRA